MNNTHVVCIHSYFVLTFIGILIKYAPLHVSGFCLFMGDLSNKSWPCGYILCVSSRFGACLLRILLKVNL